jgi:elongation factor G
MKNYEVEQIRNIAFLGHSGSGKTTLVEALLYTSEAINRMGAVEDGNTVSDFDKEEVHRRFSIGTSVVPLEYEKHKYNILDTPGYFDFSGEVISALRVSGGAVIVVDASSGVEVGTERAWKELEDRKSPKIIFINKLDKGYVHYDKLLGELKEKFGKKIAPFCIPIGEKESFRGFVNVVDMKGREYNGKECLDCEIPEGVDTENVRNMLFEAVAEGDEELMEKYFSGEEFTAEEIHRGLRKGVVSGDVVPVIVGSAVTGIGVHTLFEMLYEYMPTPQDMNEGERVGENPDTGEIVVRKVEVEEPFSAIVFKTIFDPFVGKISVFKVNSGKLTKDSEVLNSSKGKKERVSNLFFIRGKSQLDTDEVRAGDIGATTKLQFTQTGDTICDRENPIVYPELALPKPCLYLAVEPKSKDDEEKISESFQKLGEEDPTFIIDRNYETKQLLVGGQGEKQLQVITHKLENNFGVSVNLTKPKVAYRETIKGSVEVQGKHKKQTGGSGQYGDVYIKFEPSVEEFEFVEKIHGGSVPKQFIPAVKKGLLESMKKGVLAGYPVMNVKATIFDGSYHTVDSNELSFKLAAQLAFRKGIPDARPVMLEPIVKVEIIIPEVYTGEVMGDMNKRRGRILGMEPTGKGEQKVLAEVPQSEMFNYVSDLRSMTQARGNFSMDFDRYEEVPQHLAQRIIEEASE